MKSSSRGAHVALSVEAAKAARAAAEKPENVVELPKEVAA